MRPSGKARRGRIPAAYDREATQPAGMQRRSHAAGLSPPAARLHRWGARGEEDEWRWVGTSVRVDRHRPARGVRHDPGFPHLSQREIRATTNAGSLDRNRRYRDRSMVMQAADERGRARSVSRRLQFQMPVGALLLMMCGVAVGQNLFGLRCSAVVAMCVHVCERRRPAGRHQRHGEQQMRHALDHRFYPDHGPTRCQPAATTICPCTGDPEPGAVRMRDSHTGQCSRHRSGSW